MSARSRLDPSRILAVVAIGAAGAAHADPAARCSAQIAQGLPNIARVEVEPTSDEASLVAQVWLDDTTPRALTAKTCDELVAALMVIVGRTVVEPIEPPPVALAPSPRVIERPKPQPTPWHVGAQLAAISGVDIVPGLGGGGELVAYVERGAASLEAGGAWWRTSSVNAMSAGLDVRRVDVGLRTAVARVGWRLGALPVRVLAVADVGEMTGSAARTSTGPWLGVGGGVRAWWQAAERVRVVAGVESELARERVRFVSGDGTLEYEPGGWSVRGSFGVEVALW